MTRLIIGSQTFKKDDKLTPIVVNPQSNFLQFTKKNDARHEMDKIVVFSQT